MFIKGFCDTHVHIASHSCLVLETSNVSIELATARIARAARSMADRASADTYTTQAIVVDPIANGTIPAVLGDDQDQAGYGQPFLSGTL